MPLHYIPCQGGSLCKHLSVPKRTCEGTHSVHFAPDSWVRYIAYPWGMLVCVQAPSEAWYGSFWHVLDHIRKRSAEAHFQTGSALGMVCFKCVQAPLGCSTVRIQYRYSNTWREYTLYRVAKKKRNSRFFRTLLWSTVIFFHLAG